MSSFDRKRAEKLARAVRELRLREDRSLYESSLSAFVKAAWSSMDGSEFQESWALDALCEHLEAVTRGHIKRLLINFPPRCGKSNVASIAWPAWVWAQKDTSFVAGPNVRFLCGSYNHTLALQHSNAMRRLLASPFYQQYWADRFEIMSDQNTKTQYDTDKGGKRLSTSVGGTLVGLGGDVCLVDDPQNTEAVESEAEREKTLSWWKELSSTRLNDPKKSAIVVVMQRLHEQDVSGAILKGDEEYVHLMLPMRYAPRRHCVTILGPGRIWQDPRLETGEDLMWPERYGEPEVKALEEKLGPYLSSGRLQQLPSPAGGGIFKEEWWGKYEVDVGAPFPHQMVFRVGSLDPAYTAKQENDPSGWVVFGVYFDDKRNPRIVLLNAWEKWLELHGEDVEPKSGESNAAYVRRAKEKWGLVEWVAHESKRHRVNTLLVEDKASGHSVAQEIRRLYGDEDWGVRLINPGSLDKRARAYAVQHLFANGIIQAPASRNAKGDLVFRPWAQEVIDQASKFRGLSGDEDNIIDAMTQCLSFMRETGWAMRTDEVRRETEAAMTHKPQKAPIYDV